MKGRLLLDVVVAQCATIFQLLASENETLLIWGDSFLVLDFSLDVIDGVAWLNFQGNCLSGKCFHENLHTSTKTEYEMEGGLLLDVVVAQCAAIFQLLASENETLLVWGNSFLVLDFSLDVIDGVAWLDFQGNCLSGKCLDENLHTSTKTEYEMKGGFFLDVVVAQSAAIFQLLASENKTLLVWGDSFFVLDFSFDVIDGVAWLDFQGNGLSGKCLDENLHTSTKTEYEMKGGFFLDVVVAQSAAIFQLLASENKTLLVWGDSFFVLDFSFDVIDGVAWLDFQGNGLSGKCLDENLHTSTKTEYEMKGGFFLDVVVAQSAAIFQLLASENETLLVWGDSFFVLDFSFDVIDGVAWFDFQGNGLSSKCLDENLHLSAVV